MLILLLRQSLLPWIERFMLRPDRGAVFANSQKIEVSEFNRMLDITIRFQTHAANGWCIGGQERGSTINFKTTAYDPTVIQRLYSWSIVSWGADFTGLMVAFISADEANLKEAKDELARTGCTDLIVNEYSDSNIVDRRYRGLVFGRLKDDRGKGIWPYIAGPGGTVLAFSRGEIPRKLMESNELVGIEDSEKIYGRGVCLRIKEESVFLELSRRNIELMISDSSPSNHANQAISNFGLLQEDPLRFAVREFKNANIIYVPGTVN